MCRTVLDEKSFENHPPETFSSILYCVKTIYVNNGNLATKMTDSGMIYQNLVWKCFLAFRW